MEDKTKNKDKDISLPRAVNLKKIQDDENTKIETNENGTTLRNMFFSEKIEFIDNKNIYDFSLDFKPRTDQSGNVIELNKLALGIKHTLFWGRVYLWGEDIELKNSNLSFPQRMKVFNYNYSVVNEKFGRNSYDYFKIKFKTLDQRMTSNKIKDVKSAKKDLETMKEYNRYIFVNEIWNCNQRMRLIGLLFGFTASSVLNNTIFRNRKPGFRALIFLLSWQSSHLIAGSGFTRRAIDPFYSFFWEDSEEMRNEKKFSDENFIEEFGKSNPVNKSVTQFEIDKRREEEYREMERLRKELKN